MNNGTRSKLDLQKKHPKLLIPYRQQGNFGKILIIQIFNGLNSIVIMVEYFVGHIVARVVDQ